MKRECEVCGLDYSFADPADGPAFFVICFTCVPVVAFATWLEVVHSPPVWVQFVATGTLVLLACLLPLRPFKGWLVNSQYFYKVAQGVLDREDHTNRGTASKSRE